MARIFDNFAMFGYMKKNWKESKKKKKEVERKRKEKDSRFLLMCLDNGRKGKGKRKYFFLNYFLYKHRVGPSPLAFVWLRGWGLV